MALYWILLGTTYFIYYMTYKYKKNQKSKKLFLIYISIPMILVMGLRSSTVGVDTIAYVRNFNIIRNLNWTDFGINLYSHGNAGHYEFGYYYLNKVIGVMSSNPQLLLFIVAIIIVSSINFAIYHLSDDVLLSVSLFQTFGFFCYSMALMRQFIAVSILMISFYYFVQNKFKMAFLTVCVASLFHTTALIFIIVYILLILSRKFGTNRFVVTLVGCTVLPVIYNLIITFVPRYQFYLTYQAKEYISSGIFSLFIFVLIILPMFMRKSGFDVFCQNELDAYLIQLLIVGIAINLFSSKIQMLGRVVYMFTIFIIFYVPRLFKFIKRKDNQIIIKIIIYIAQVIYYFNFLYNSTASVCPYLFFWQ